MGSGTCWIDPELLKTAPHEAHTGDKAPSNVVGFLERVLVRSKINDDDRPRFLVGCALGHEDGNIVPLMEDGSVRYNVSSKYSPQGRSVANDHHERGKMKNTKPKGAMWSGVRTWNQRQSLSETHV